MKKLRGFYPLVAAVFLFNTLCPPLALARGAAMQALPEPGQRMGLTSPEQVSLLRGITIDPANPFRFNFMLERGEQPLSEDELKVQAERLVRYFLASLTVPEKDLWVNLSPYEKNRVVPEQFGLTEMGRDMLAEDYILKQMTASLIYPEGGLGKDFWDKVYKKALALYGTTDIPVNTFNKVWIVPQKAVVYEHGQSAFVARARLKVMLEQDYRARNRNRHDSSLADNRAPAEGKFSGVSAQIVREIVLPALEEEVNTGKNFAQLRQIYYSLILAVWYKKRLQESVLSMVYVDRNKISGVESDDLEAKNKIYDRYVAAYKKGVYNYIKEEYDPGSQSMIPRRYFSGGTAFNKAADVTEITQNPEVVSPEDRGKVFDELEVNLEGAPDMNNGEPERSVVQPLNTSPNRNGDTKSLLTSGFVRGLLDQYGINLEEGRHQHVVVGPGIVPFDTRDSVTALNAAYHNPGLEVITTEQKAAVPVAHIRSAALLETFGTRIAEALRLRVSRINELILVVTRRGSDNQPMVSEIFVNRNAGEWYLLLAVAPDLTLVRRGQEVSEEEQKQSQLFNDIITALGGQEQIRDVLEGQAAEGRLGGYDVKVDYTPLDTGLQEVGSPLRFTEDLGTQITGASTLEANNVTVHMDVQEKEAFLSKVRGTLQEGGVALIKNTLETAENEFYNVVTVYQKRQGELVEVGSAATDNYLQQFFGRKDFDRLVGAQTPFLFDRWAEGNRAEIEELFETFPLEGIPAAKVAETKVLLEQLKARYVTLSASLEWFGREKEFAQKVNLQLNRLARQFAAEAKTAATEAPGASPDAAANEKLGGIDFNPESLSLEITGNSDPVTLPLTQTPFELTRINGFIPIITTFTPAQPLPTRLGL